MIKDVLHRLLLKRLRLKLEDVEDVAHPELESVLHIDNHTAQRAPSHGWLSGIARRTALAPVNKEV